MIIGNGIDIIEINRIEAAIKRQPQLLLRIFSEEERSYFSSRKNNIATIAGCFAAKEATVKAAGGGFIREVRLSWDENGKPSVTMAGREGVSFLVSITHSSFYAAASVIAVRNQKG